MNNNKQSSVEWLFEQVCNLDWRNISGEEKLKTFEQAKSIHKEEMKESFWESLLSKYQSFEHYYEENYKK